MKVKELITTLQNCYSPNDDLFVLWYDSDCVTVENEETTEEQINEAWATVVEALAECDVDQQVNDIIADVIYQVTNGTL
jgi:hypothetical protein